jgi:nucleoside-diphosphate-sugar epimerase
MRAAVTGARGFIGRNLCERLLAERHKVMEIGRGFSMSRLYDFGPDWIFHLAAEIYDEAEMFDSNVALTYRLLEATKDLDYSAFVYVGSSSEYGRSSEPMRETDRLIPTTLYEATKGCGSLLCQAFAAAHEKRIVIARPFSVYGGYEPEHRLIPRLLAVAGTEEELSISNAAHDFIYVKDVVRALLKIAAAPIAGDIVNIGTGRMHSNVEVVEAVERVTGKRIHYRETEERLRPFDSNIWVCDPQHARGSYDFVASFGLEAGLHDYA